jgi:glycosyltransferase involved in cell wall biosynthesis
MAEDRHTGHRFGWERNCLLIVYAADSLDVSGMGQGVAARNELLALLATGHPVTVVTHHRIDLPEEVHGISLRQPKWILLSDIRVPHPPRLRWPYLQSQWRLMSRTRKIRALCPSLVIVQGPRMYKKLTSYRSWATCPRWITLQGTPYIYSKYYTEGYNEVELRRTCRNFARASGIVQLSNQLVAEWRGQPELTRTTMRVIPNTISEEDVVPVANVPLGSVRDKLGIPLSDFVIVCNASVQYRKGQDVLLSSLDRMASAIPKFRLILIGPVVLNWGGRDILRQIEHSPLRDRVRVCGKLEPKETLMHVRAADVVVLPSRDEGMPLAVLEAMCLGKPVVASDVAGIPDLILQGKTGLMFSHKHPDGLTEGIIRMNSDSKFRQNCSRAAEERYWSTFSRKLYFER